MRNVSRVNHSIHLVALHFIILRHVDIPQYADMPHSPLYILYSTAGADPENSLTGSQ